MEGETLAGDDFGDVVNINLGHFVKKKKKEKMFVLGDIEIIVVDLDIGGDGDGGTATVAAEMTFVGKI